MRRLIFPAVLILMLSAFATADGSHASLTPVKTHAHHAQKHDAHKAVKHHAPKHHHNSV